MPRKGNYIHPMGSCIIVISENHSMGLGIHGVAESEPSGLMPSRPTLRPADVLTSAFHNGRLAAIDVGVICLVAAGAGPD